MLGSQCPCREAIDTKEELRTSVQSLLSIEIQKNDTNPKDTTVKKKKKKRKWFEETFGRS